MGFCPLCIKWIHGCLSSVSYFFNINAVQSGYICLSRAIKQGHPSFSYLFVFCAEGLSNLINNAVDNNKLTRVKISRQNPPVSHLFFAANSWIFCKAKQDLQCYEQAFGQQINIGKSAVFFSKNTSPRNVEDVMHQLGGIQYATQTKYLSQW